MKVLLHLEDTYETDDFTVLRHSAMVAANVHCPIMVRVTAIIKNGAGGGG